MQDELYFYVMLFGLIVIGFGWFSSRRSTPEASENIEMKRYLEEWKRDHEQAWSRLARQLDRMQAELESLKRREAEARGEHLKVGLGLEQRYAEIFELVQRDIPTSEIAKRLDMGVGEVELILQLHRLSTGRNSAEKSDERRPAL